MNKVMILVIFGLFIFSSCSKDSADKGPLTKEAKVYTLEDLTSDDFEYQDGQIIVTGLCVHVCAHSGKKMFLTGKNPENKLQIFTSDKISAFDKKFDGSNLQVTGTLEEEKIDMNYISEWENEVSQEAAEKKESCNFEESMKKIDVMKARIAKSKKGYISQYTMTGFEVKAI